MSTSPSTQPSSLDQQQDSLLSQPEIKRHFANWLLTSAVIVTESATLERFRFRTPSFLRWGATANYLWAATGRDWITKTKRLGFSTIYLLFSYWVASTHQNRACIHVSRDEQQNRAFLDFIRKVIHPNCVETDTWHRPRLGYDNRREFTFPDYGSKIVIAPPKLGVGRGDWWSVVHTSELPWWVMSDDRRKEIAVGLYNSMLPDGVFANESTPRFKTDFHGRVHFRQDEWGQGLQRFRYSWPWKWTPDQARARMRDEGPAIFWREHGCRFTHPGEAAIPEAFLRTTWELEEPMPGAEYAYGVDPAEGVGGDASVISLWRREGHLFVQAAEAASNRWGPRETARQLKLLCDRYDPQTQQIRGYIERNNHGHAVIEKALDMGVPGMLNDPGDGRLGYNKTMVSKITAQTRFVEALTDSRQAMISSRALVDEMGALEIDRNGCMAAAEGFHDDRWTAAVLAVNAMLRSPVLVS